MAVSRKRNEKYIPYSTVYNRYGRVAEIFIGTVRSLWNWQIRRSTERVSSSRRKYWLSISDASIS